MKEKAGYSREILPKVLRGMFAVAMLGLIGYFAYQNYQWQAYYNDLDQLNNPKNTWSESCWGENNDSVVPKIVSTPTISPELVPTMQAVQAKRVERIEATQTAQQAASQTNEVFAGLEEYTNAIFKYGIYVQEEGADEFALLPAPISEATAMLVGAGYGKQDEYGSAPLWVFLLHNHVLDEQTLELLEKGKDVEFIFFGIDKATITTDWSGSGGRITGCRKIITDGQHAATLVAVEGPTGYPVEGSINKSSDQAYKPAPIDKIGGPCTLENGRLKGIGFPATDSGRTSQQPLISEITGPYVPLHGVDQSGREVDAIVGTGLVNFGSSGEALIDSQTSSLCAVVNYQYGTTDKHAIFNVLPPNSFMQQEILGFIDEQVAASLASR